MDVAGARVEVVPGLVEADGQHLVVVVEEVLHPVAVVQVDVQVGHAPAAVHAGPDGHGQVVVEAEARRPVLLGVVQPPAQLEHAPLGACQDHPRAVEGPARQPPAREVHAREDGIVRRAQAEPFGLRPGLAAIQGLDHGHEGFVVDREDLFPSGGRRRDGSDRVAQAPEQIQEHGEPAGREGMLRTEVVRGVLRPVDQSRHGIGRSLGRGQRTVKVAPRSSSARGRIWFESTRSTVRTVASGVG